MDLANFSAKWFVIYYILLGLILSISGILLVVNRQKATEFLSSAADSEKPPRLFIRVLKYFLLFTLPGIVLSFFPFSWIELLFTLWSLLVVYIAGLQLVRWDQTRALIEASSEKTSVLIRRIGAIMVAVGLAILLLAYFVISRTFF